MGAPHPPAAAQRLELQGVRAVAITAVLLFHFLPDTFPNGYLGVDMFFVLSGFLISSMLTKAVACRGFSLDVVTSFYYRRIKRLLPLHLLYVFVAVLLFTALTDPFNVPENQENALAATFFFTNVKALFDVSDYFEDVLADNPFTHIWSLSVEVQFYLVAPAVFAFSGRAASHAILVTVIISSLALHLLSSNLYAFNLMPARLWQFLAAALLLAVFDDSKKATVAPSNEEDSAPLMEENDSKQPVETSSAMPKEITVVVASLVLCAAAFLTVPVPAAVGRIAVTAATALLIRFGDDAMASYWLRVRPMVFIGDISYSLYLVHWPFVVYIASRSAPFANERLLALQLSVFVTLLVHYGFERPYRVWSKARIGTCCGILFLLTTAAIVAVPSVNKRIYQTDETLEEAINENAAVFKLIARNLLIPECTYSPFRNLTGSRYENDVAPPFGVCDLPDGEGGLRFAVIGSSYAPDHASVIHRAFRPYFSTFRLFSQKACEVLSFHRTAYCLMFVNYTDVLDDFKPDVTFVLQRYYRPKEKPIPKNISDDIVYNEMKRRLGELEKKSSFFYILDAMPAINKPVMNKLIEMIRAKESADVINNSTVIRDDLPFARARTKRLAKECTNCVVYDVVPEFLDSAGRYQSYDGETHLAYFEPVSHFTPHGRKKALHAYEALARQENSRLRSLEKKLHSRR